MADTTTPVVHPDARDPTNELPSVRSKADPKGYIAGIILILLLALSLITIISGRWIKAPTVGNNWSEIGLWSSCDCNDAWKVTGAGGTCNKYKEMMRTVEAFAVASVIVELFVVLLLWQDPRNESKMIGKIIAVLAFLAGAFLIITWAIYAATYEKTLCGEKVRDSARLNWAFGIKVAESGAWIILTILLCLQGFGTLKRNRTYFLVAFVILALGIVTTTSRGWIKERPQLTAGTDLKFEGGVWEICTCVQVDDLPCSQRRNLLRTSEAFHIISIVLGSGLLVVLFGWIPATPNYVSVVLAFLTWFAQLITWISIAAFFAQKICGAKLKTATSYKLHWGFGLHVAISGIMIIVIVIVAIRSKTLGKQ
jgi:hypothetical protein